MVSVQFQRMRIGRFCEWLSLLKAGIVSYLKQRGFGSVKSNQFAAQIGYKRKEKNEMLECDSDEQ